MTLLTVQHFRHKFLVSQPRVPGQVTALGLEYNVNGEETHWMSFVKGNLHGVILRLIILLALRDGLPDVSSMREVVHFSYLNY